MAAADPIRSQPTHRGKQPLAVVEAAGADTGSAPMAVSIAGVSTACSKDALASSAQAVRKALSTD